MKFHWQVRRDSREGQRLLMEGGRGTRSEAGGKLIKTVLSDALIGAAGVLFIVSVLDIILTDSQKKSVDHAILQYWNTLDDLKRRRLLDWLQARRRWLLGVGILLAAAFVLWAESRTKRTGSYGAADLFLACVLFGLGIWFGWWAARWILNAKTLVGATARATIAIIITFVPLAIFVIVATEFVQPILPSLTTSNPTIGVALLQLAVVAGFVGTVFFSAIGFLFWFPVAIPLAIILVIYAFIWTFEFVTRKLGEYSRGVVVALIVFFAALATFLKVIS
jgi:hypothetical protein